MKIAVIRTHSQAFRVGWPQRLPGSSARARAGGSGPHWKARRLPGAATGHGRRMHLYQITFLDLCET